MEGFLLNEQTWLQHLKEKRLAYGLSQNRLAVATGITRQYLSDIETGKVKPSEDLQQSLWEALERFNPDAPLEMLFDYVRIRFPTTDVQQVVENILQLKLSYFLHEDYGFYSYSEHYALGDIFVLCSHTAFKIINRYIRFVDKDDSKPRSDWKLNEEWAWFIGNNRERLKLTTKPEPYSFQRTLNWLSHQVAPTLKVAIKLDEINQTQVVKDILDHAKLTDRHKQILKQQSVKEQDVITTKK